MPSIADPYSAGYGEITPEELDRLLGQGYMLYEDGSLAAPDGSAYAPPNVQHYPPPPAPFGQPSAGAMNQMNALPPQPAWQPGKGTSPLDTPPPPGQFSDPIFAAHMGLRNPQPQERDPMKQMMRDPFREPKPGPSLGVPGGASIVNGMPQAAPMANSAYQQADPTAAMPPPKPGNTTIRSTYNVTMAPDAETAGKQYETEAMRGSNAQAKRDYEEMTRSRKVNLMRGFIGRR